MATGGRVITNPSTGSFANAGNTDSFRIEAPTATVQVIITPEEFKLKLEPGYELVNVYPNEWLVVRGPRESVLRRR